MTHPLLTVELVHQAADLVRETGKATVSHVQRHLKIGYTLAYEVIESLERSGIITEADHIGHREIVERGNEAIFRRAYQAKKAGALSEDVGEMTKGYRPGPGYMDLASKQYGLEPPRLMDYLKPPEEAISAALALSPMDTAPKDGRPVLLKFKDDLTQYDPEGRISRWAGLWFVGVWPNKWGWCYAGPLGQGGFDDRWLEGWYRHPLMLNAKTAEEKDAENVK